MIKPALFLCLIFAFGSAAFGTDALALLAEINLARTEPQQYAAKIAALPSSGATAEAIRFLKNSKPLTPLNFSAGLTLAAQTHVTELGPSGGLGHGAMGRRLKARGDFTGCAGENISYGLPTPAATVIAWIVDEGIANRGHRRNIFRSDFKVAGASVGYHARFGTMSVMDFAGGFVEKGTALAVRKHASFANLREL